jgi:hypothetical protein
MNSVDDSQRISALSLSFDAGHFVQIPRITPTLFEITFLAWGRMVKRLNAVAF